jgi:hypothetical protein
VGRREAWQGQSEGASVNAAQDAFMFRRVEVSADSRPRDRAAFTPVRCGHLAALMKEVKGDFATPLAIHGTANVLTLFVRTQ